jgi:hypothetical protein
LKCRKCGVNKISHSSDSGSKKYKYEEDWKCKCGEMNFKPRQQCRKCAGSKSTHTFSTPVHYKESDWKCQCGEINFDSRTECRKCGNSRNGHSSNSNEYKYEEGDWECRCGEMNFKTRLQCRKCHVVKDDIIRSTNEKLELDPSVCSICMVNPKNMLILTCKHLMCCSTCTYKLTKNECPICRTPFIPLEHLVQTFV